MLSIHGYEKKVSLERKIFDKSKKKSKKKLQKEFFELPVRQKIFLVKKSVNDHFVTVIMSIQTNSTKSLGQCPTAVIIEENVRFRGH